MKPQTQQTCPVRAGIEEHIPHLRRYARALAHNAVAADDLLQDCLTRALLKAHLFQEGTNLRAWLFTILHNLHVSERRRAVHEGFSIDPDWASSALAVQPDQDQRLVLRALDRAMALLPREQRRALHMVALEGMPYEDVASALDLPIGTVKSRISRGRAVLRQALEGREVRASSAPRPATGQAHGRCSPSARVQPGSTERCFEAERTAA